MSQQSLIRHVDIQGNQAPDEVERYDDANAVFSPNQHALECGEWTVDDVHSETKRQIRVRLGSHLPGRAVSQRLHFVVAESTRWPIETHEAQYMAAIRCELWFSADWFIQKAIRDLIGLLL